MKKKVGLMICAAAVICISGCASITKGSRQSVGVSSSPIGVTFTVEGMTYNTPAIVKLKRNMDHIIVFHKDGYADASGTISSENNGWIWGNLIFLWGAPVGIFIDYLVGSYCDLSPTAVNVTLQPFANGEASK